MNNFADGGSMNNFADGGRLSNTPQGAASTLQRDHALDVVTYFQPFYNLRSDQLQGFEALARRRRCGADDTETPAGFLAVATAAGVMRDIDLRILNESLAQLAQWRGEGNGNDLIVSVNLSWDVIRHPNFFGDVIGVLTHHRVPGDRLLVDMSIDTFRRLHAGGRDGLDGLDGLRRLQERAITFCLDQFTTENLDVLADAVATPVDIIKLHPRQLAAEPADQEQALARLAEAVQDLGLPVVAAGVETPEQLALVSSLEFEWAQGFLLDEPVPAERALADSAPTIVR